MHLDVESLRTYVAVLEWGSMTRAAEHVGLTQSAVSWKIKRLEQRVGRPLLIRDGHTLRPTRDGRILLADARTIVAAHDRAVYRLASPDFTGTVKVGANEDTGAPRMASILGRFKRMHPGATIEFVVNQSRLLAPLLERGAIDVAVIQVTPEDQQPDDVVLWSDELRWVAHRDMPFDDGVVPLVTFGQNGFYRPVIEPILDREEIEYTYTVSAPTSAAVRAAVAAGLGVGVLASRHVGGEIGEWARAADFEPLPPVLQIVRTVPGEQPDIAGPLIEAIVEEFTDRPTRREHDDT
ncbi:MAG: LysR family transcriptional regulator [Ilumatobacter sp.]|nr:LysR family transcriptional regulator [Ilumatobacter sp.]